MDRVSSLEELFERLNGLRALIIGDVMIDSYIWGKVERISPEAPVPVVTVTRREKRLGGAANVALNVQALGATPVLCALVGDDTEGQEFRGLLADNGLTDEGIITSQARPTTMKERVLSGSQQMLRVDNESDKNLDGTEQAALLHRIQKLLGDCDVVIFEDYDKGCLNATVIEETVKLAGEKGIPTVVDPKKRNFMAYRGVSLFKPNLKELKEGLKIEFDHGDRTRLGEAIKTLADKIQAQHTLVTLSEKGVAINHREEGLHFLPAHVRDISDVSGAGDTVVSIASLALALNLPVRMIAALSNLGGGLVCEHLGVVPINKSRLFDEARRCKLHEEL
ncbi:bifunctional heptose 7-phosphate kinase/heptose 1-phosphate adenyltransferase [Roseivirga sp. BDSF3-8]|uniref:bifunctional heptose 7-phosphate kinase/heptose 1-phosphate adenyltransferase n=1 Tax=Roseivirga sp. BDSF3-8 TaxID=3241598 RepID=UPI00353257F8